MSIFEIMQRLVVLLDGLGAKSIKIGLERSINIDDFPLIRVVPNDNELDTFDGWAEDIYFSIYLGDSDDENLELCLKKLYELEASIKFRLHNYQFSDGGLIRFIKTSRSDEFRHYTLLRIDFKCESMRLF
ncbi:hypothetical protein [Campylobacter ureolyticus]|uniref:hypothetical protein n=1 Tax=Campylobacter ureolyticus TaxID=827 RepID=UPI0026EDB59E|nr:hypothetical protein [Campylobacter ureolyticus]